MNAELKHDYIIAGLGTTAQLQEWIDKSFAVAIGVPRAYMEIPIPIIIDGQQYVHREVYVVLGIGAEGPREKWEGLMVRAMHATLDVACAKALSLFDNETPLMFIRRPLQLEEFPDENKLMLSIRLSVPGVDLRKLNLFKPEGLAPRQLVDSSYHGDVTL